LDPKTKFKETEIWKIPEDWSVSILKNICVQDRGIQTGPFGSQLHQRDYKAIGTPIITVEHLGDNHILHRNLPRVSDEDRERLTRYTLCVGDIVFSRVGSVDRRALVRKDEDGWLFSGRCLRVRPNPTLVDPCFLSWFFGLPAFKEHIRQIAVGATMPSLNTKLLSNVEVILPPLLEQRTIASILGALDDKIELNRQMNATLEQIGQAIFKHWFVDFEFPNEDGKPYRSSGGEMVDSELGEVPEGWGVGSILEIAELLSGGTPKTKIAEYWGGGIPWVSAKDVANARGTFILDTEKTITRSGIEHSNTKLLPKNTTIVTARGTVGSYCILSREMAINQTNYGLKAKSEGEDFFVFFSVSNLVNQMKMHSYGTVFDTITTKTFKDMKMPIPPKPVIKSFDDKVTNIMNQVLHNLHESTNLAVIRDALLPKLISGEVRVKIPAEVKNARS